MLVTRNSSAAAVSASALTIGNFDGVHRGHQAVVSLLMAQARARGLRSCVVTFEPHPREFFAPDRAPTRLTSLREKLELLRDAGVEQVHVCRFNFDFARRSADQFIEHILLRQLQAKWVMVGDDFRFGARRLGHYEVLRAAGAAKGFSVERMPTLADSGERVSSTRVRQALEGGELDAAAQLLGRPYSISGRVVRGDQLGRTLGFPTANVQMKHNRPPVWGIFVVEVEGLDAMPWPGVASVGVRPTVNDCGVPVLEVHLFEFGQQIYGKHVRVRFLKKLRDEEKYAGLAELTRRIAMDVQEAKQYFAMRK
ncbi:MAG: bifunctional riboflavin kinase/FAD synthetase [Burkholderiales bacterium]